MLNIIKCNSAYNMFNQLTRYLSSRGGEIENKIFVFCEDKISMMTESSICAELGGSFNVEVSSFARFLSEQYTPPKLLSKEGSTMVIRKLVSGVPLSIFKARTAGASASLYNLIVQLKSAKITPSDLAEATKNVKGILQKKLADITLIYTEYEKYLAQQGYDDQSSILNYLPKVILDNGKLTGAEVVIFGYISFTAQVREAISQILKCAKSVTAILPYGENKFAFVNETTLAIKKLAKEAGVEVFEKTALTPYTAEGEKIISEVFAPKLSPSKTTSDKIYYSAFINTYKEIEAVAEQIKTLVLAGYRYKDFKIALPSDGSYLEEIKKAFNLLDIPYFYDEKKKAENHPLVTLITSYAQAIRKNFEFSALADFYKNPLVCQDKTLTDEFENYLLTYNVNYNQIKKPLPSFNESADISKYEQFREQLVDLLSEFNVKRLLEKLNVSKQLEEQSEKLKALGKIEEGAITLQIYQAVMNILGEMEQILGGEKIGIWEYLNVFTAGVSAMEISIIPQYNDAVFIGGFREASLTSTKILFAVGLTSEVPQIKQDVSLISDEDISYLTEFKLLIEPKIKVVNHRERETTALGLASFTERLYLSYPTTNYAGGKNLKSEILDYILQSFTVKPFSKANGYITKKQGIKTFCKECSNFARGISADFNLPSAFYKASGENIIDKILDFSNSEIKVRLNEQTPLLTRGVTSATAIESYQACPYRYFIEKSLMVGERKQGKLSSQLIGTFMHAVFCDFIKGASACKDDFSVDLLFNKVSTQVLKQKEFAYLKEDVSENANLAYVLKECRAYCAKVYKWLNQSKFKAESKNLEVRFGDNGVYPAIQLLNGKVKLSGYIDRVDTFNDYARIIDYKTGSATDDSKTLVAGTKLQLYLYASAVSDKKIAGVYYLAVKDEYKKEQDLSSPIAIGKTLDDKEIILSQDQALELGEASEFIPVKKEGEVFKGASSRETINAYIDYAKKVSERALCNMQSGYIAPSPYEKACEGCKFKSMCGGGNSRKLSAVSDEFIEQAIAPDKTESVK